MGWLKDWFDSIRESIFALKGISRKSLAIRQFHACTSSKCIESQWNALTSEEQSDPDVITAHEDAIARVDAEGGLGLFGSLPGVLYDGLKDLTEDMSDAAGAAIADSYTKLFAALTGQSLPEEAKKKLAGTNVPEAIEGIMDSIIDVAMLPFDKGAEALDKEIPATAKTAIREIVKLGAGLGATIGLSGYIMEHFHPTKSTNAARSLNMILDMVGFRTLRDAYLKPLRWNLIELPLRYKWNSLIQPVIPTQGEITGLARKYEITPDEYRDAMHKQGVGDFWIDKLLQGFWADPRLFEIIRLMEVERPPEETPDDAKTWLTNAGLKRFIGPDWWLAMKFGKAGYDHIDIPVLVSAVKARNVQRELGDIRTLQRNQYKHGMLSREEYEKILAERRISSEEVTLLLDAIDIESSYSINREYQRAYERKYAAGRITKDELKMLLEQLGLKEEYVEARVEFLFTKKQGKLAVEEEERVLTKAEVVRAYRLKQREKGWAIKQIDDQGYTTEDASLLVDRVDVEKADDVTDEWVRAAETRTLNGRMTIKKLTDRYVELGKAEDWAEARAAYIEERLLGKVTPE